MPNDGCVSVARFARRKRPGSRREESPSEGEEEPRAAGAERLHAIRQTVEAASGRAARRCAEGADPGQARTTVWLGGRDLNPDSLVQSQLSYH